MLIGRLIIVMSKMRKRKLSVVNTDRQTSDASIFFHPHGGDWSRRRIAEAANVQLLVFLGVVCRKGSPPSQTIPDS